MLRTWKYRLKYDWNFMRILRLIIAAIFVFEAWRSNVALFAGFGVIILFQAILNVGCCSTAGCSLNRTAEEKTLPPQNPSTTNYEVVK